MTTIVYLVRHGQTNSNIAGLCASRSDEDLNDIGYAQARRLSARLATLPIASVFTSPLRRAYSTAVAVAEPHGIVPMIVDDLIEINHGDWQGLHIDEISHKWPEIWKQWMSDPSEVSLPNGESLVEVAERAIRAFRNIVDTDQDKQTIVISHEITTKLIVVSVLGASKNIYRRFEIGNASLSTIRFTHDQYQLLNLNDTSHLQP